MTIYPANVNERFLDPRYAGRPTDANAVGVSASFACGCFVRFSLEIDTSAKVIKNAGFESNGCGFMIAAADIIAEEVQGRELADLHSLEASEHLDIVRDRFDPLPADRTQCLQVPFESLRAALADHRNRLLKEFQGDDPLVCTCFGVSEGLIEKFIAENSPATVDDVSAECRAGSGCGSCRMLIQEMIDQNSR